MVSRVSFLLGRQCPLIYPLFIPLVLTNDRIIPNINLGRSLTSTDGARAAIMRIDLSRTNPLRVLHMYMYKRPFIINVGSGSNDPIHLCSLFSSLHTHY